MNKCLKKSKTNIIKLSNSRVNISNDFLLSFWFLLKKKKKKNNNKYLLKVGYNPLYTDSQLRKYYIEDIKWEYKKIRDELELLGISIVNEVEGSTVYNDDLLNYNIPTYDFILDIDYSIIGKLKVKFLELYKSHDNIYWINKLVSILKDEYIEKEQDDNIVYIRKTCEKLYIIRNRFTAWILYLYYNWEIDLLNYFHIFPEDEWVWISWNINKIKLKLLNNKWKQKVINSNSINIRSVTIKEYSIDDNNWNTIFTLNINESKILKELKTKWMNLEWLKVITAQPSTGAVSASIKVIQWNIKKYHLTNFIQLYYSRTENTYLLDILKY